MSREKEQDVWDALAEVRDPELGLSITELGLVREIQLTEDEAIVEMTLTTPACPYGPQLLAETERRASEAASGLPTRIELVWDPPWDPFTDASDDALAVLGIW